jgi:pyruvate formate lyase activating enzyme
MAGCRICFRQCELKEGQTGACGARIGRGGESAPLWYGKVSGLALDPIEKKPLYHFHPGSRILSVGSLGCNLHCAFCQNHEIAQAERGRFSVTAETVSPEAVAEAAERTRSRGNIGVAYTYNEPLVGYEFVRDTAKRVRERGMANVLVTNGTAALWVLDELSPYIDAMNIDLKGFTDRYYTEVLKGSRRMTMDFIREAVKRCHVELTTLIVPGENDTEAEITELSAWVAGLKDVAGGKQGREIPLHVSRFFPRWHMKDRPPTDVGLVYRLAEAARRNLDHVYTGNC